MQKSEELKHINEEQCGCCQLSSDKPEEKYDCASRSTVFTKREEKVLRSIRELGEKARELKKRIEQLSANQKDSQEHLTALNELENLRQQRTDLEKERVEAAEERMRLLGHA
ncbi:MAG: hypothetical protein WCA08_02015 [Desulfoferrobacter sp.]